MKESELIKKIKENDSEAFKIFYETYKNLVYNVCYRMLNNRQDAEDVTQDIFVKAIKSIHKFRGDSKISTWIYQITVNTNINYIRRKRIRSSCTTSHTITSYTTTHGNYSTTI